MGADRSSCVALNVGLVLFGAIQVLFVGLIPFCASLLSVGAEWFFSVGCHSNLVAQCLFSIIQCWFVLLPLGASLVPFGAALVPFRAGLVPCGAC